MSKSRRNKINTAIIVLGSLTALAAAALFAAHFYNSRHTPRNAYVAVPDNLISAENECEAHDTPDDFTPDGIGLPRQNEPETVPQKQPEAPPHVETTGQSGAASADAKATSARVLRLYKRHPDDNTPFHVSNMFPGDAETKYFLIQVSHKGSATIKFRADIRPGYEKLAEVLKCRVDLLTTGETLCDCLMRDMPRELNHLLATSADNELYYKITAYLDTSVGNGYQDKELVADFIWWTDDEEGLTPVPATGIIMPLYLWAGIAFTAAALFVIIFLLIKRRKKKEVSNAP